jgi:hypothetical protein
MHAHTSGTVGRVLSIMRKSGANPQQWRAGKIEGPPTLFGYHPLLGRDILANQVPATMAGRKTTDLRTQTRRETVDFIGW